MNILDILKGCHNMNIYDAFYKCQYHLRTHQNVCVSISGGADSDVMLDIVVKVAQATPDIDLSKIHFTFFNTGIEYEATKRHLDYLEQKYNIKIERLKAIKPVPYGTRQYGLPFLSKHISEMIQRLQRNNFDFANDGNKSFNELLTKYPKCKSALKWFCNENGEKSSFNISKDPFLKEFLVEHPPQFKISPKCCDGAKKNNGKEYTKANKIDLNLIGIRKAEGGIRAQRYQTCFSKGDLSDYYRPLQWFTIADRREYEELFNIKHSDCYTDYGLKRTGCAGCPFGSGFDNELEIIETYEPKLYKAVNKIFKDSYEYTRAYKEYKATKGALCFK